MKQQQEVGEKVWCNCLPVTVHACQNAICKFFTSLLLLTLLRVASYQLRTKLSWLEWKEEQTRQRDLPLCPWLDAIKRFLKLESSRAQSSLVLTRCWESFSQADSGREEENKAQSRLLVCASYFSRKCRRLSSLVNLWVSHFFLATLTRQHSGIFYLPNRRANRREARKLSAKQWTN